ncbi:putative nucleotidyltransferase domain protein [Candidatus Vecturithrix granuli]|uniref:Putative nucleotidyltransferase domain protein n=1 Tax=Vecturithrix granuli TaxID=1499967 RepID=A0A081C230_VECG1|nr:putative nucleotidyltransferase domain protein [Candidatus Vecturithrix granuli]
MMEIQHANIIKDFAKETKEILQDNLVAEYLFGSCARNEQPELSDIDILIIVKHFDSEIRGKLSDLSSEYSVEKNILLSSVIKDIQIWEKNRKYNTLFYQEVTRDGIKLS